MEPLSPNDPLHTLLGKAKAVEPRPNFTQNVMRAILQMPQTEGLWQRVQEWLGGLTMPRLAVAAAALVIVALSVMALWKPAAETPASPVVVQQNTEPVIVPAVVDEMLYSMTTEEPMDSAVAHEFVLLAQEDTSALTDSEIALLLY